MNAKKTEIGHTKTNRDSWNRAAARGALVWGTVYSTASSGAAYLLTPMITGSTPAFSDIFVNSLIIFPTAGAARGLVLWRMKKERQRKPKHPWFVHNNNKDKKAA